MPQGSLLPQIKESDLKEKGLFRLNSVFQLLASRLARLGDLLVSKDGIASSRGFLATGQDTIPEDANTLITLATARKLFHPQVLRGALVQGLWVPTGEKIQPLNLGAGGGGGGGAATVFQEIVFNLAAGTADISVATAPTPPRVTVNQGRDGVMALWVARAGIAPTGASIIIEVLKNGLPHTTITIPDGNTVIQTVITNANVVYLDVFTVNVLQVGSGIRGRKVFLCGRYNLV